MLEIIENAKINAWKFILAAGIMALGDWAVMTVREGIIGIFNFSFLSITGLSALLILLGWTNVKKLFGKLKKTHWKWILFAIIADFILALFFAHVVGPLFESPIADNSNVEDSSSFIFVLLELPFLFVSLMGEELLIATLFILVFTLVLKFTSTKSAVFIAGIISLLVFGLSHYGVYDGNLYQCLIVIGIGHIPTLYAWLKTETLWVPIFAHVMYDFILMLLIALV